MSFVGGLNFTMDIISLDEVNPEAVIDYDHVYNQMPLAINVKARTYKIIDSINNSFFYFVTNNCSINIPNGSLLINVKDRTDQYIVVNTSLQYGYGNTPHHQNIYAQRRKVGKFQYRHVDDQGEEFEL